MSFIKFLKTKKTAQATLEYIILVCLIVVLTIISLNANFLSNVRAILQGTPNPIYPEEKGFFGRAADKML
jgi:uncharacterized protein (UPF0333 family)